MPKKYWLMKSEPDEFSIQDLKRKNVEPWTGIRNYQARNFLRDEMSVGDEVLFYHSSTKPPGIAGTMTIASAPYPDPLQFKKGSKYFDESASKESPRWISVDVQFQAIFATYIPLEMLKKEKALEGMKILQKGTRLSVTPVTASEFKHIVKMGGK
ncbi:MAG: EVE domain-containing protein [Bacteriovoracaceae bacterium]|nr:EVE domain-containing protein [Bacteriovoracaceae bacterium]